MFSATITLFLLRLLIAKCALPMITFFLYFIENFNQRKDQGPVTAARYEVNKIINHAFVDSLSDTEKKKAGDLRPNSILDKQVVRRLDTGLEYYGM